MKKKTSAYVKRALKELGFNVDVTADGLDGLHFCNGIRLRRDYSGCYVCQI